ncbi:MAG: hypothetical protein ACKV19_04155 [Verrucomicrobiales bacterium]
MLIALAVYNAALVMRPTDEVEGESSPFFFTMPLLSGARIEVGWDATMLAGGLILLFLEILKSTRSSRLSTLEHILSVLVFILFLVEFLIIPAAGTTVFALLAMMSLIDVMAGYAISISAARRDLSIGG